MSKEDIKAAELALEKAARTSGHDAGLLFQASAAHSLVAIAKSLDVLANGRE